MKVARKNVYAREDCFDASERDLRVSIQAYRNMVQVRVWKNGQQWTKEHELTLAQLAELLTVGEMP